MSDGRRPPGALGTASRHRPAPADLLASTPIFAGLGRADLDALVDRCTRRSLGAGQWCFEEGDVGDSLFVVVSGRLRVYAGGQPRHEIGSTEVFGEIALITGLPRTVGVRALRDSELLALPADAFYRLVDERPLVLRRVAEVVIGRLLAAESAPPPPEPVRAMTLVDSTGDSIVFGEVVASLAAGLGRYGSVVAVGADDAPAVDGRGAWAHDLEGSNACVLYRAERTDADWLGWCSRQADRVVVVADASRRPSDRELVTHQTLARGAAGIATKGLFVHRSGGSRPSDTAGLIRRLGLGADEITHYHLRRGRPEDAARVARLLSGRALGLVLGGGGPRGFAHLGVMRALDERGIPVDAVGGTSIGGVMGAYRALDLDSETRERFAIESLVNNGFLFSPTLPMIALSSGRKIQRLLDESVEGVVGELGIEDAWLPFFCVSSSLTRAEVVIHSGGAMAKALRASVSLPGLLPPVRYGADLLLDGGLLNNLPVDVMRRRLVNGEVLAVDLGVDVELPAPRDYVDTPSGWRMLGSRIFRSGSEHRLPNLLGILLRSKELASVRAQRELAAANRPDLRMRPPVDGFAALDFAGAQKLIEVGYKDAMQTLEGHEWADRSW